MAGKSLGIFTEPKLDERECEPRCKRDDNRFSLVFDVVDFEDTFEELRKREKRFFSWGVFDSGCWSPAKVGGDMSSWVLVSVLMKVNSGRGESLDKAGSSFSPASSRIFSLFFRRSRSVIFAEKTDNVY